MCRVWPSEEMELTKEAKAELSSEKTSGGEASIGVTCEAATKRERGGGGEERSENDFRKEKRTEK